MKKLNLILMALCLNVLAMQAQEIFSADDSLRLKNHASEGVDYLSNLSVTSVQGQWIKADELVKNARKYHTEEETDSLIRNYIKEHANEEGCVMYYLQKKILPKETMLALIPDSLMNGQLKKYISTFYIPDQEDIIKKLPGAEKHEDGSITINGKVVQKILVDDKVIYEK